MVHVNTLSQIQTVPNAVKAIVNSEGGYDVYQKGDIIPPTP